MFLNNMKMAGRVIARQKLFSVLNIVGLGVSLACLTMILIHVQSELGYERGYPKSDRIYRIQTDSLYATTIRRWAASAPSLGPELERVFPEIEYAARILPIEAVRVLANPLTAGAVRRFEETRGVFADPAFLRMFDLEFREGDPRTALLSPSNIVLTASMARKYFGAEEAVGRVLMDETEGRPLQITGVIRDFPAKSHLKIDYLISISTFPVWRESPAILDNPTWKASMTYVLVKDAPSADSLAAKVGPFMKAFHAGRPGRSETIALQPIRSIHLHSKLEGELGPNSDIAYVLAFSAAAFLVLLIAAVNFINLATAQAFKRMKEIGVRKVVGAQRSQLVRQFLGEAGFLTVLAAGLALVLVAALLPLYNHLSGSGLSWRDLAVSSNIAAFLLVLAVLAAGAGFYPAVFISSFRPIGAIKDRRGPGSSAARLRRALVVFQFAVSIFLVFSTITMSRQLAFFRDTDLGFHKDGIIAVDLHDGPAGGRSRLGRELREEARRHPAVDGVGLTNYLFGTKSSNTRLIPPGTVNFETLPMMRFISVDEDFVKTMGLTVLAGRDFAGRAPASGGFLLSESAAASLQLKEPLGLVCSTDGASRTAPVVGLFKDFHFASLHSPIEPLVLEFRPQDAAYLLVRVREGRVGDVLGYLKERVRTVAPDFLFRYRFVDDVFDRNYRTETRSFDLFKIFSGVAFFVAALGLFGLAAFAAESRDREFGIRKVLGASAAGISGLLSKSFLGQVLAADAMALPLAYFVMRGWLRNFAFHTTISAGTFLWAGLSGLIVAAVVVSGRGWKAALKNPLESLRHE